MCSPASPKILYRNPRFLRVAFLQLHHQQQSGVFCDALLQAEGEAVPAHCCILSACSPFFTERLERERPVQGRKVVLELGGLKIQTLRKLVDFLYTSEMEVSQEEAQDVLSAARQLRVSELETLQLEGGKLVKAPQGRRLNRECLQPPSAAPISARVVVPRSRPRTPLPVTQTPSPLGAVKLKSLGEEEGAHKKSNLPNADNLSDTLLLKKKARVCLTQERSSSPSSQREGPKENKSNPGSTALPSLYPSVDEQLLPRKIRLSRSKPSPHVYTSKPSSMLSGPSSMPTAPGRRLWRQRTVSEATQGVDKQKPGEVSTLQSTPDPPDVGKTGGKKQPSPESRAPASNSVEEGQVGRVKLRKIVNGTCWEVVQEPPIRNTQDSPQILESSDADEPPGTLLSSVNEQEIPARIQLCHDSPENSRLQDILLSASHSPDHPVVKSEFGSSPMLTGKEPELNIDCREPYTFDTTLLSQPCEAEQYRITSAAATSELEEILDFMLCGSDVEPPVGSLESPGAEGCRTPSYHLSETGKNWIEGEEWCLPDMELWPRDLTGLEKEPVGENKEPVEPFSPLVMRSENTESIEPLSPLVMPSEVSREELSLRGSWTPDLEITSSQPLDGQGEKLIHLDSSDPSQRSYSDLSPPCPNWADTGLEVSLGMDEVLCPVPKAVREVSANPELLDPFPGSSEDEEIDVVDWTVEGKLGPTSVPSVWPDPSSESETEVDILT
ncbi:BTB/POZ domain-containing protein 18 [Rattus norvegicus]|uniref:BTB/POZ domain-containing protein 18 n=1 Tax=Rattus norvegicus TaxID=10116 RepID=D3Z9A5_RAT|nr:BTB/POZ domain-containing protein 18 [Rattus norvegicus]XP_008760219.1 BTB/POZ domain-containing protein 18 [Rattus norvegicus]|eukprot:XP_002729248.1 PREDICTED: BTB/POZ domain-containing protein 18 [Rattus norvegicus]